MADKKNKEEMVEVTLPIPSDPNAPMEEFYSVNGKNYIIQRGVPVKVPVYVKEVIDNSQAAQKKAMDYIRQAKLRER